MSRSESSLLQGKRIQTIPCISRHIALVSQGGLSLDEADNAHFLLKYNSTEKFLTGVPMHFLCKKIAICLGLKEHLELQDCLSQNIIAYKYLG